MGATVVLIMAGLLGLPATAGGTTAERSSKRPEPPTKVKAEPGDASARVTWRRSRDATKDKVRKYVATARPGGKTCTVSWKSTSCTVRGLTNGTSYTFTVRAETDHGKSPESTPSRSVTPQAITRGVIAWGSAPRPVATVPLELQSAGVTTVSATLTNAIALKAGRVIAWGSAPCGAEVPADLSTGVTAIANGGGHMLALKDGRVYGWGCNIHGEATVPPEAQSGVTAVAAPRSEGMYSLAVKDGGVMAWGLDPNSIFDVPIEARSGVTAVAAGRTFALALKDGGVIAWGSNLFGELDVPDEARSGVSAIAVGESYALALKGGRVIAWGTNYYGETSVPEAALSGVTSIAASTYYALAIKDGRVILWGYSDLTPDQIPGSARSGLIAASASDGELAFLVRG